MKQEIVGSYSLGMSEVQIVLREDTGGEFYLHPEYGHTPRIKVGADVATWHKVVAILMHEAMEMEMTRSHCRFNPAPDFGGDHSSYLFLMTHPQFSDVTARVAAFLADSLQDVGCAWKKWNAKPSCPRKRKTKPRSP